ncbi:MAG: hypothetical protein IIZ49_04405 [Oscillospiraceae bacterium]|nr:hypothetical protein [Oscillospiraceae bacterium]MBQ3879563.1 hypothetical protein [Oscillospiraceae bacterium]
MELSPEIWQTVGAFTLSLVLAFLGYILPVLLLVTVLVMLCMKRFAAKRRVLAIVCAALAVWIVIAWLLF